MNLAEAKKINDDVREFFKKGYKSDNKLYDVNHDGSPIPDGPMSSKNPSRVSKRAEARAESSKKRLIAAETYQKMAENLLNMPESNRSGNCTEMACLAAYYACDPRKSYNVKRDCVFIVTLCGKGDHVFCLVCTTDDDKSKVTKLQWPDFSYFSKTKSSPFKLPGTLVIDPWLNVACYASNYLEEAGAKLEYWAGRGKKINWGAGPQGPGWYPPNGEYKKAFEKADLSIEGF
jgi:hypothetical protein